MKFDCEYEDLKLIFTVEKSTATGAMHINQYSKDDEKELKSGQVYFYSIIVESFRGDEKLTHYIPNQLLTADEDELLEELEILVDEEDIFEQILEKWELVDATNGPHWKK